MCRDAIKIVEMALVTEQAWPELHRAAEYKQQVLLNAVTPLAAKDTQYKDILKRITKDEQFVKVIGKWVCVSMYEMFFFRLNDLFQVIDRLAHHRGIVRTVASDNIALFQLGIDEGCKARVKALIDNDVYVYPGEWGVTEKGQAWLFISVFIPSDLLFYSHSG